MDNTKSEKAFLGNSISNVLQFDPLSLNGEKTKKHLPSHPLANKTLQS